MSQIIPIYIPTYISDQNYNPARILPRLLFYNGQIECEQYYIQDENFSSRPQTEFPYFDNYNVVSGSFPTTDSKSLLFNNEGASYGEVPTDSLYTTYWEKYISLLYNPKTRLLNCSAIIPLKDYFQMQLNDIVNFRGNYYHLRAINDYSLKTGECNLQLLGPIIADTFASAESNTPTTTTTTTTSTTTTSTTTTSTTTTTTSTTLAPDCRVYRLVNNSSVTIFWGATLCNGSGTGGSIPGLGGQTITSCIIPGTITASGTLTITETAIC